jgi:hypothetical protein
MAMRHETIQNVRVEAIKKHRRLKEECILMNRTIDLSKFKEIMNLPLNGEARKELIFDF